MHCDTDCKRIALLAVILVYDIVHQAVSVRTVSAPCAGKFLHDGHLVVFHLGEYNTSGKGGCRRAIIVGSDGDCVICGFSTVEVNFLGELERLRLSLGGAEFRLGDKS